MPSSPVTRLTVVMPGVAMLDPVASSIQREGEIVVAGHGCHECQNIEVVVDSRAPAAVIGLRAGSEEQAAQDERSDDPDLPNNPFCRMHCLILHAWFRPNHSYEVDQAGLGTFRPEGKLDDLLQARPIAEARGGATRPKWSPPGHVRAWKRISRDR